MHIIPNNLPDSYRDLAAALARGLDGQAPADQAATALLLRIPAVLNLPEMGPLWVGYPVEGPDGRQVPAAAVMWAALAGAVDGPAHLPVSSGELAVLRIACQLTMPGGLGHLLGALDEPLRRAVVEAVAHAAGVDIAPADTTTVGDLAREARIAALREEVRIIAAEGGETTQQWDELRRLGVADPMDDEDEDDEDDEPYDDYPPYSHYTVDWAAADPQRTAREGGSL